MGGLASDLSLVLRVSFYCDMVFLLSRNGQANELNSALRSYESMYVSVRPVGLGSYKKSPRY
jgi:hypothetical protein